jgi:molecular chaperone DnaK (HSP70)
MIIGIDLGTNNICMSYFLNNELKLITDNQGNPFIKSLIAINDSIIIAGNDVLNINDKEWTVIRNLKRLIGMSEDKITVKTGEKQIEYSIVELTSFLLSKIKKIIDAHLNGLDYQIILTVPAYFNERQRQATKDAFSLCGMNLLRIVNEPTSACITYYHYHQNFDKNVMVIDIGAGTTDISILTASKDDTGLDIYEVIGTSGDNLLGGEDINNLLFEKLGLEKNEENIKKIEQIKVNFSDETYVDGEVEGEGCLITRNSYDEMLEQLKDKLISPIDKVLKITNLDKTEIDNVILIGGTSKVIYFKKQIESYFNKNFKYIINPMTAVSFGAALYGSKLVNNQLILMDIVPLSLGIETVGGQFAPIIERGSTIPLSKTKQFTTEIDNQLWITFKIYQGESQFIHENFLIGEFILKDIPKQPQGVPVINVTIAIDVNGLINITATDRKNFATSNLVIENKTKLSDEEIEKIIENKKLNDKIYDDYVSVVDNFYLFRNYYEKINFNTNINCVNKMTEQEKIDVTTDLVEANKYMCSIANKFEDKLKLDLNKYCSEYIEVKETDIKRLVEFMKEKNEEIKSKYEILILNYNNDGSLLNNSLESVATIEKENNLNEEKIVDKAIEEDYESEFYNLIEQIHANMNDFEIKDEQKISLIEYISIIIANNESYKDKINNLNLFTDKLLNIN